MIDLLGMIEPTIISEAENQAIAILQEAVTTLENGRKSDASDLAMTLNGKTAREKEDIMAAVEILSSAEFDYALDSMSLEGGHGYVTENRKDAPSESIQKILDAVIDGYDENQSRRMSYERG